MTALPLENQNNGFARLKLFLALSRTPHGLIDMATPAFAALLWLGAFPPITVILLGLVTTFAGYTAVYALNDIVDYRHDKAKAAAGGFYGEDRDLDAVLLRHPMARGVLSYGAGLAWGLGWAALAMVCAYLLNPVCVLIFVGGCLLEVIYCLMWDVSPYRTLVSGAVKTSGALAAVYAVDPHPSPGFLLALFLCLFLWEIGGQNVPNDWTDLNEDRRHDAKTIPVRLGADATADLILGCLLMTVVLVGVVFNIGLPSEAAPAALAAMAISVVLLLLPAMDLQRLKSRAAAMTLFNRASYFPLAMLGVVLIRTVFI